MSMKVDRGEFFGDVEARANRIRSESAIAGRKHIKRPFNDNPHTAAIQPDGQQVTMVDWLRVTNNDYEAFQQTMGDLAENGGILFEAGMDVTWKPHKGMHGYAESASILI